MNQSESKNQTLEFKFFKLTESINFHSCFVLIVIGLIGNLLTIYLLKSKPRYNLTKRNMSYSIRPGFRQSLSSSQWYMLTLAISDSLFLLSHLIEDVIPSIDKHNEMLQFINKSNFFCKTILYIRNSTRVSSSYLVVFFAYERFVVISSPLKRLKLHNKKFTRLIIIVIFLFSFLITSYTPFINGLRIKDNHEVLEDSSGYLKTSKFECDVLKKYKLIYEYTILGYTTVGIMLPIMLVCYFNAYIARVLLTRKNRILRHYSQSLKATSISNDLNNINNNSNTLILKDLRISEPSKLGKSKLAKGLSIDSFDFNARKDAHGSNKARKGLTCCYEPEENVGNIKKSYTFMKEQSHSHSLSRHVSSDNNQKESKISNNTKNQCEQVSTKLVYSRNSSSEYVGIAQRLKESGRATIILIVISLFFVVLNLPYIITWALFYIPYKRNQLKNENDIYFRYSFVMLAEVLHLSNFSINLFLYCMASKAFRSQLMCRLLFIKSFKIKIVFN